MAISYVGGNTASATNGGDPSVSLTALTGGSDAAPLNGDLVIVTFGIGLSTSGDLDMTMVTTGYTEVADLWSDDAEDANMGVFYKFMTATPDTTCVVEGGGNNASGVAAVVQVFRGVRLVADGGPFDAAPTTATGINTAHANPPSITFSSSGVWTVIAGCAGHVGGAAVTYTNPTNYTTDAVTRSANDTDDVVVGMGYRTDPTSPEDPGVMTSSVDALTSGWAAVTMALEPIPAGGATTKFFPVIVGV